jgi:hypothetical protein
MKNYQEDKLIIRKLSAIKPKKLNKRIGSRFEYKFGKIKVLKDGLYVEFIVKGIYPKNYPYYAHQITSIGEEKLGFTNSHNSLWHWVHHLRTKTWFTKQVEKDFVEVATKNLTKKSQNV